jgi:hypothetical protein
VVHELLLVEEEGQASYYHPFFVLVGFSVMLTRPPVVAAILTTPTNIGVFGIVATTDGHATSSPKPRRPTTIQKKVTNLQEEAKPLGKLIIYPLW